LRLTDFSLLLPIRRWIKHRIPAPPCPLPCAPDGCPSEYTSCIFTCLIAIPRRKEKEAWSPFTLPFRDLRPKLLTTERYTFTVGDITRTYIASSGVPFTSGDVCVFEGLTHVQSLVRKWYTSRLSEGAEGDRLREADRQRGRNGRAMQDIPSSTDHYLSASDALPPSRPSPVRTGFSYTRHPDSGGDGAITPEAVHDAQAGELGLTSFKIVSSEPIVDRRSTFVGHAVRVTDEREVPLVIHELLSDRKIAKAAHPAMFAYRIARDVGGVAGKVFDTGQSDYPSKAPSLPTRRRACNSQLTCV